MRECAQVCPWASALVRILFLFIKYLLRQRKKTVETAFFDFSVLF